jgi:hypothetical protein
MPFTAQASGVDSKSQQRSRGGRAGFGPQKALEPFEPWPRDAIAGDPNGTGKPSAGRSCLPIDKAGSIAARGFTRR